MGEFSSSKTTSSSEEQLRLASKMWARACMFCSLRLTRDFQSEPLCMKSAEWFWQGWVWSAACAVCLLFFLRYRKSMRLTCVNCCRSTGGSEAIVYPQGALEDFPPSFQQDPRWAHSADSNTGRSFEVKEMTLADWIFLIYFYILWLHSLLVMSQVKSKSWVSVEESAAPWWFNRPGQPNSSAVVAFKKKKNFWFLLYNSLFPPTSLFLSRRPQLSIETYCCLVQQLCSHILHITGGSIMKLDR